MKTTVGKYLLQSIQNLGITDLFGVPGDYNLLFLDDVMACKGLRWVGNTNELNAGYAADAYAKIRGISALLTTGGVGELSALNAIGGAFAESVPIIHIVGHPSLQAQQDKRFIHHFLEQGERFTAPHYEIAGKVSHSFGVVTRYNATLEIPRLLQAALYYKKPVTLYLPSNENNQEIEAEPFKPTYPTSNPELLKSLTEDIYQALTTAKSPLLLVDVLTSRFSLRKEIRQLIKHLNIPVATTLFGRGALDETSPQFVGMYTGERSSKKVMQIVNNADAVLIVGGLHHCDYNTGYFTAELSDKNLIQLQGNYAINNGVYLQGLWLHDVLKAVQKKCAPLNHVKEGSPKKEKAKKEVFEPESALSHLSFWQEVSPLLKEDAIGVFEVGTAIWASTMLEMGKNTEFVGSYGYASIGYATPAVLGTSLADGDRRTIAFIGDGSFQLTAQAVSSLLRHKQNPVIFLLNNDGYTIERVIHGPNEVYNDVQMWDYQAFAKSLTLNQKQIYTAKVKTVAELKKELKSLPEDQLVFIEVILDKMDAPQALKEMFENPPKVSLYT